MFERFTSDYFIGELDIEFHAGEVAVMDRDIHDSLVAQLGQMTDQIDGPPVVMKVGTCHIQVYGDPSVGGDVLGLPEAVLDHVRVTPPEPNYQVLLAEPEAATTLLNAQASLPAGAPTLMTKDLADHQFSPEQP